MKEKLESYLLPLFIMGAVILNFIIFYAVMKVFGVWEKEITAAIIGFLGSIIGGILTLVGVRQTIQYQEREKYLNSATEKLIELEEFEENLSVYLNRVFMYELSFNGNEEDYKILLKIAKDLYEDLGRHRKTVYKYLDVDEVRIINSFQKSLRAIIVKSNHTEEDIRKCVYRITSICNIALKSKDKHLEKYYEYRRQQNKIW
ncbi:hypothetical protein [Bacillus sp. REN10]|uniref:hypothetical protein n=1 Tax=Bacillus sp. REN10 TaxID=2782541 RepID=UPI00193C2111|nr:hypothetical protein [Bacillus sp. REN10]